MTRPATTRLQRTQPVKIRTNGLHKIEDTAATFAKIVLPPPVPAAIAAAQERNQIFCNATTARNYTCPELAPYSGRPGAMDAFDKPSRVGSALHYRGGRTEGAK